jgi:GT2 family glycosyltransferase
MTQPDVSILIVNYNVKDYLLQCLRSIERRDPGVSVEVVVVDNASHDKSVEELRPLMPWVTWVELPENIGFGRGNNAGLEHCHGRYVLFLNPDTVISADTLNTMTAYMDAHTDVGVSGCKVLNADGTFQLACRRGFPTPWASFCKLFGLQALFPNVPLFSRYNQTWRSIDETYDVDALIGAFMFARRDVLQTTGGFDPAFFMYGEDLDLCYRIKQTGARVMYVHTTSIVHFKGESTKRSSMDEVSVFYDAMKIFAQKHYGRSRSYLALLWLGITLRSVMARVEKRAKELTTLVLDVMIVNAALMAATTIRFDGPLAFPDYAYPTVFIALTLVFLVSMLAVGEYIEYRPTVRRSSTGLLVAFFGLMALTYFFKDFGFSRGVLLMTIGFSAVGMFAIRSAYAVYDIIAGTQRRRRILIIGVNDHARALIERLRTVEMRNAEVVGVVATGSYAVDDVAGVPIIGSVEYLSKIVSSNTIDEVVTTDRDVPQERVMAMMQACAASRARFHIATDYDEIVTARIIHDVAGIEPTVSVSPLASFRIRWLKRVVDMLWSVIVVPCYACGVVLGVPNARARRTAWMEVLMGTRSIVGIYPDGKRRSAGKSGITGLVQISGPDTLSSQAIVRLNDFYVDRYSLSLDVEIIIKHLTKTSRGSNHYS